MKKIALTAVAAVLLMSASAQVCIGVTKMHVKLKAWYRYGIPIKEWQHVPDDKGDRPAIGVRVPQLDGTITYYFKGRRNYACAFVTDSHAAYKSYVASKLNREFGDVQKSGYRYSLDNKYQITSGQICKDTYVVYYEKNIKK